MSAVVVGRDGVERQDTTMNMRWLFNAPGRFDGIIRSWHFRPAFGRRPGASSVSQSCLTGELKEVTEDPISYECSDE
jgi:hypothetical protein